MVVYHYPSKAQVSERKSVQLWKQCTLFMQHCSPTEILHFTLNSSDTVLLRNRFPDKKALVIFLSSSSPRTEFHQDLLCGRNRHARFIQLLEISLTATFQYESFMYESACIYVTITRSFSSVTSETHLENINLLALI